MDVACEAAGLPCKSYKDFASHVEWEQYNNRRWTITFAQDNEWEREQEEEKITRVRVWDCIHERMWPILEEILSLKATTLAGLAVQARAASLSESELWDDGARDNAWDERQRDFIESVCAVCGVTPVPLDDGAS